MAADAVRKALDGMIRDHGTDYASVSKAIGRNHSYIQQFIKRGVPRQLPEDARDRLGELFSVDPNIFRPGHVAKSPPRPPKAPDSDIVSVAGEEYAVLSSLDYRAAAGPGGEGTGAVVNRLLFRHDWLRSVTRAPLEMLKVIEVNGDSMEPTLRSGDHVLVDLSRRDPSQQDGLYVLSLQGGGLQVKRVSVHPVARTLTIGSDNGQYETYRDIAPDDVHFAGQVIWLGRRI